jgi:hypothetical protein
LPTEKLAVALKGKARFGILNPSLLT